MGIAHRAVKFGDASSSLASAVKTWCPWCKGSIKDRGSLGTGSNPVGHPLVVMVQSL